MELGYAHYRSIGTKEMRIQSIWIFLIDELHCLADIGWSSIYGREGQSEE